jgi:peptide/nickel transport system ATP-binding protein
MTLLRVDDLRTRFLTEAGEAVAVDGVTFSVGEGEAVGIVGESGGGKTVTALSILGLVPDPPGRILPGSSIRYRGEELVAAGEDRLRAIRGNEISMIFQEPSAALNPVRSVGSQIVEGLRLHRGMNATDARQAAVGLLDEVGIDEAGARFRAYPHELSGGMQQRAMIAMALACEPSLLIADEPTSALDVTIQAQILDLIRRVSRERGMATLLITHDVAVVAGSCDRILVMYGGQIVEAGATEEVLRDPRHPYTRGLLESLPALGRPEGRLTEIPGSAPSPTSWPEGCRFHPRCGEVMERCTAESPPAIALGPGSTSRGSRCWLHHGEPTEEGISGATDGPEGEPSGTEMGS